MEKEKSSHLWTSASSRRKRRKNPGYIATYAFNKWVYELEQYHENYAILDSGEIVRYDLMADKKGSYPKIKDKVYLGKGRYSHSTKGN